MPSVLAVIELNFDPLLHIGALTIRWETIGVTAALFVALGVAALMAPDLEAQRPLFKRRPRNLGPRFPEAPVITRSGRVLPSASAPASPTAGRALRLDDMVLIVAGTVPGAVVGGRLVHALSFFDAYASRPLQTLDPSVGSLSLLGAVIGGALSGAYVARVVGAPVRRWADAAAVPLLLAIGLGKLAQLLGGSGQGLPFNGLWAIAFTGDGPWVSAGPATPAHPSQLYEAVWVLIGIPIALRLAGARRSPSRVHPAVAWADRSQAQGFLFVGALGWFLIGRILVAFTWRDDHFVGPLATEQVVALIALTGIVAYLWWRGVRNRPFAASVTRDGIPTRD
jgi:prolipoprotein diacylglyceryltransferase